MYVRNCCVVLISWLLVSSVPTCSLWAPPLLPLPCLHPPTLPLLPPSFLPTLLPPYLPPSLLPSPPPSLPSSFPRPPPLSYPNIKYIVGSVIQDSFVIAIVTFAVSVSLAQVFAKKTNHQISSNQVRLCTWTPRCSPGVVVCMTCALVCVGGGAG